VTYTGFDINFYSGKKIDVIVTAYPQSVPPKTNHKLDPDPHEGGAATVVEFGYLIPWKQVLGA
jgi:hypothetical protein